MSGCAGKILRVNLTDRKISAIPTSDYQEWIGGHGMGSAIFWDLVPDKNIDGFDPKNVVTIMTSPLTGTMAPGGAARVEVQAIGVQSHPIGWFTRSNMGGRFGPMLKYAGWDGIVIEGKADRPAWLDVRDGEVKIRDAKELWGRDAWLTQQMIRKEVTGADEGPRWIELGDPMTGGRTTQKPAVVAIGQAGERLSRIAALIHDAGNAAGQGGFGAVFGAKNLKAISVIGTGRVKVARPQELIEARLWARQADVDNLEEAKNYGVISASRSFPIPLFPWKRDRQSRPQSCTGCPAGCRQRNASGDGNESQCAAAVFYTIYDRAGKFGMRLLEVLFGRLSPIGFGIHQDSLKINDLAQKYGINAFELLTGIPYIRGLYKRGLLGPGKDIDCDLPFNKFGEYEFGARLLHMIAYREGAGAEMADGFFRASEKWGRLDADLSSGVLNYPNWGLPGHYDPRYEIEWGYGSILGDRDINEHGFVFIFILATLAKMFGQDPPAAEEVAQIYAEKMTPFAPDPAMLDFSTDNMYSEPIAKTVAWHRRYTRFWKQSALYCDFMLPDFVNVRRPGKRGMTGEAEQKFVNAVTGMDMSFEQGIEMGRKIWNLDNAIWTLQGRRRDMVRFADFIYNQPLELPARVAGLQDGKWEYVPVKGRTIDRDRFEDWKTAYYRLEGWDPRSGWPTRETLESAGLADVARELEAKGRIGGEGNG